MKPLLSNSGAASSHVCVSGVSEPLPSDAGIYVGKTATYRLPFYIDTDCLLNPHMAALGMTGSGKTYFLKSYIIRSVLGCGRKLFVLDWTGEYGETIAFLSGDELKPTADSVGSLDVAKLLDGVASVNLLHLGSDAERKAVADRVMGMVIERMHNMPISSRQGRIILLDEAWKMLGDTRGLGQLFREGRKFGFHVVIATQMVKDISNEILSNTAAVLVFRLQNGDDYSTLSDTGIVSDEQKRMLPELQIGSCFVRLAYKDQRQNGFLIKRVCGVATQIYTITMKGEGMQLKATNDEFMKAADSLPDRSLKAKLVAFMESNDRSADLESMVKFMAKHGAGRPDIVVFLRLLGIDDKTIVGAYESCAATVNK